MFHNLIPDFSELTLWETESYELLQFILKYSFIMRSSTQQVGFQWFGISESQVGNSALILPNGILIDISNDWLWFVLTGIN